MKKILLIAMATITAGTAVVGAASKASAEVSLNLIIPLFSEPQVHRHYYEKRYYERGRYYGRDYRYERGRYYGRDARYERSYPRRHSEREDRHYNQYKDSDRGERNHGSSGRVYGR